MKAFIKAVLMPISRIPLPCMLITGMLISAQSIRAQGPGPLTGKVHEGYQGIWFTLGQFSEYGDKYSGGLGTYTAKHTPLAIYAPSVQTTFFVYGGTTGPAQKHLLCMIGSYDHSTNTLSQPVIVHDKDGVDDPHDNPSLLIDPDGYLWVFVSGRGRKRPGFKYRSTHPYSIDSFTLITSEEMTYPQPWYVSGKGFFHFFTKYTGVRELYYEKSENGRDWSEDRLLASIKGDNMENSGHYQISAEFQGKVGTFFNWHPNGNVDARTNLYYMESTDFGDTWQTAAQTPLTTPLRQVESPALVRDYYQEGKNVYLKDIQFEENGDPVCLFITSGGHEPGPSNNPREWTVAVRENNTWRCSVVTTSDHNYDMGSLWVDQNRWMVVAPTTNSPQPYGAGGEIVIWISYDKGKTWTRNLQLTADSERNHNYIRRVENGTYPFQFFWADGNPDTTSTSLLYFGSDSGEHYLMPYKMEERSASPAKK